MFNRFPERRPEWYGTSAETVRITRDSDSDEDIKSPRMSKSSAKINVVDPSKSKPVSNSIATNDGMFALREHRVHVTQEDFLQNPVSMKQAHHNTINDSILSILLELLILVLELYLSICLTRTQPSQKKRNIINEYSGYGSRIYKPLVRNTSSNIENVDDIPDIQRLKSSAEILTGKQGRFRQNLLGKK
jgi:hypothetical protein